MCTSGCKTLASDPANCGTCGHTCADPPVVGSGSATCSGGSCGLACNAGYLQCSGTNYCQVASWDFEDGSTDGFAILGTDQMAVTSISASTSVTHGGVYALAIGITATGGTVRGFEVGLKMCGGSGYLPSGGRTISAWFYLSPSSNTVPPPSPTSFFGEHLYTSASDGGYMPNATTVGSWFQVSSPIDDVGTHLLSFALQGYFGANGANPPDWDGVVYIDDITIQ
jgi:hypothetical protein